MSLLENVLLQHRKCCYRKDQDWELVLGNIKIGNVFAGKSSGWRMQDMFGKVVEKLSDEFSPNEALAVERFLPMS